MCARRFREFREFGTDSSLKLFVEAVKMHEDRLQDTIDRLNFPVTVDGTFINNSKGAEMKLTAFDRRACLCHRRISIQRPLLQGL